MTFTLYIEEVFRGSEDFLIRGETIAFLKPPGTAPSVREQLTSLVIEGRRISKHSFTRKVGHGSSRQDLVGDLVITFRTSSSETNLKRSNLRTSEGAGRGKESVFTKPLKLHRPLVLPKRNIINVKTLKSMISFCQQFREAVVFKAVILTAFFGFFRLSNIAPHAVAEFDCSRHFTGGDVFFLENEVKLLLKWSKTFQNRDQYKLVALPKLAPSPLCPYQALKGIYALYAPGCNEPLFQIRSASGWQVLTDSRVRKTLSQINKLMGLPGNFYTFHAFRRSGASLAYEADIPVKEIKEHGTWASDSVWRYIQPSQTAGQQVSQKFRKLLHGGV